MRPTGTAPATVAALAELSGLRSAAPVEVAVGDLAGGAGAPVTTEDGTPLVVQAAYGSGRIVELAFDPLAAPFDTQVDLAAVAWSQAVDRGLSGGQGGAGWTKFMGGSPPGSAGLTGSGPGSWGTPAR